MSTNKRIILAVIILAAVAGAILITQSFRRGGYLYRTISTGQKEYSEGCVPVSSAGTVLAKFCGKDSEKLKKTGFRDKTEKKLQEGWLLRDVVLLYVSGTDITPDTLIRVVSTSRGKKVELSWNDISAEQNNIILALTRQGNLKLVSTMKGLDTREQWVQDVDSIEIVKK